MKNLILLIGILLSFSSFSQRILVSTSQQYLKNSEGDFYTEDYIKFIIYDDAESIDLIRPSETITFDIVNSEIQEESITLYCYNENKKRIIIELFFDEYDSIDQITILTMDKEDLLEVRFLTTEL